MNNNNRDVKRLREIYEEMRCLLHESYDIVRWEGTRHQLDVASAYWHGHIACALDNEHNYVNREHSTMLRTIEELESKSKVDKCTACGTAFDIDEDEDDEDDKDADPARPTVCATCMDFGVEEGS